ncbi:hypothetical protein SHI21_06730 [Bacteriovorax sp. PP10]|uniref:Sulfatase-modifying factor enzyme domain-containing protein n=1 Tax=Bacteriovorax antarcticus TaxID=3088717 RepID=A0ABU5VS50_9BACT|nr:hypothetical protein [Bacteriovorax sp. PP10]MEA9355886.1 hypothetical protein [Bacteriovorax sp. PP10]
MSSTKELNKSWHYKQFLIAAVLFLFVGCIEKSSLEVSSNKVKKSENLNVTVSNIQIINHQIVLTGTHLDSVTTFNVKEGATVTNLQIESKSATSIVANTLMNVTFAAGKIFDFILSSASASSTFTINFSLCDSTLGGKAFDCLTTPLDKQVLSYDQVSGKWMPRDVNGLSYIGTFDASTGANPAIKPAGQYYIVSVAGDIYTSSVILGIGDWIVSNGTIWQKIDNSTVITSVFGRTGVVSAIKGDYTLTKLADVDVTTITPLSGDVLKFDGTNWVPGVVSGGGGGTVTAVSGTPPIASTGGATPAISISQATTTTDGYLSSANWNTFNNKEPAITAQGTTKFFRGDKTFVTLDTSLVPENTNLYFTDARAIAAPITAPTLTNSAIATSDTIQVALGKLQAQLNNTLSLALTGLSTATSSAITAADSILIALGKLQAQITTTDGSYVAKAGGSTLAGTTTLTGVINVSTGLGRITVVDSPAIATDVANKAYVDNATSLQRPSSYSPSCPTNYISVPAIPYYPGPSFCVMKYEAKTGSNVVAATTAAAGTPVATINRNNARTSCRLIGAGYDLISNAQWQTIARNIADQPSNWSTGTAYSGELNRGHSDGTPASKLAASTDNDGCSGTGQTCSDVVWDSQRRTNTLSNGEVIWDMGGNLLEWVSDNNVISQGAGDYTSMLNAGDNKQIRYGNDQFCGTPTVSPYCGMGFGNVGGTSGAVLRGGYLSDGDLAGVFATLMNYTPTDTDAAVGFRCVFIP